MMTRGNRIVLLILFILMVQAASAFCQVVNKVVAVVNDEVITQQDVNQLLAILYAQYVHAYSKEELVKKMEEIKKDILIQMIEDKLILSRAKELDIKVSDSEIDEKLDAVKKGFPSEKAFLEMLQVQGITIANLKDRYRDQIMMKKLVDLEVKSRVAVLPSEMTDYYEKHKEEFKRDKRYKIRHILIKAEDDVGFELAKVEIADIYNRLKAGEDFAEIAKQYSQGPNKDESGDMGYIKEGDMIEELNQALAVLNPGEFSEPVKSKIGYHILKVEDIQHSGYFSLEEAQQDIKMLLLQAKFKDKLNEWLRDLRNKAYISIK